MTALDRLTGLLRSSLSVAERPFPQTDGLDPVIAGLKKHNKSGTGSYVPEDLQQAAIRKFWDAQRFETLKDARLVSFGMCVPNRHSGPCIMEDRQRFQAVLDSQTGVDQWVDEPRWYRRCYQGLLRSYFTYDAKVPQAPSVGKQNWRDLRDYLSERTHNIVDKKVNPDWVTTTVENRQLFGEDPCAPFASDVLSGDTTKLDLLCEQLGVIKSSWFLRELVLAQVRQATKLSHEQFKDLIPRLLELLSKNLVLRDRGLILMLDKYASTEQPGINEPLRNVSVEWWGNPWLPSNETRWGGVVPVAREMVSEWLKREFIEAFFTKLAEDGVGDRRRANFWLRYVKSMEHIQFALGARALNSRDRDFEALRKKMKGLFTELKSTDSSNNAFIMTLGDLVAVEFGGMGNAFYGYDVRKTLPFDASRPVGTTVNAPNSLKHKNRILWMQHQDGIKGWNKWEDMFEATLKMHFDILPNAVTRRTVPRAAAPAPAPTVPPPAPVAPRRSVQSPGGQTTGSKECDFSRIALDAFARIHELKVDDNRALNGNLWVRTDDNDLQVNKALLDWGFQYKLGKGWWQ
ncbi:MAG: hypothetical protein B7Y41_06295 [Hydrogenophilales bacterium 28-61-23]|nr:MAG: hypothetical protein B7Y41_06295 [Hydrogenophilales bacterium 28-61-23]